MHLTFSGQPLAPFTREPISATISPKPYLAQFCTCHTSSCPCFDTQHHAICSHSPHDGTAGDLNAVQKISYQVGRSLVDIDATAVAEGLTNLGTKSNRVSKMKAPTTGRWAQCIGRESNPGLADILDLKTLDGNGQFYH